VNLKQEILDEIKKTGVFWLCPSRWQSHGVTVTELCSNGFIEEYSKYGGRGNNNEYAYVLTGNPDNISWKQEGNNRILSK